MYVPTVDLKSFAASNPSVLYKKTGIAATNEMNVIFISQYTRNVINIYSHID